ncbi:hermansky-Pudlak syndrome 1 protein homolog [Trichonephila inaurata madagascariensis]|uniref:Hermansky-Pudlak syndrome 1 protein homolog n=1 Tax=Trichonephila inaurata madagascariensis TaxID=2747483 RepID=A0A8X6WSJ8_9ARAC|nr:hermansky-Pudlak syndrome 1 protein homolog [Trichonephila inaurata madagascariensis]
MIFDNLNDLIFSNVDADLSKHIQKLAMKDGLLEGSFFGGIEQEMDKNVVMQLFSPLIASYKVMQAQFGNRYQYIESEDGILLVFDEILNYIAVSICRKDETLDIVQKELSLCLIIVEMLYGPSLHMMKNDISVCCEKFSRSDLVALIIDKWRILNMEQQMYLVEAVERIIINPDITAMCINLLQEILEKIRHAHKDGTYSHAFILVDSKLLALYSSRNSGQLPKETLLLLTVIIQVLKYSPSPSKAEEEKRKAMEDEFFIPISPNELKGKQLKEDKKNKNSLKNKAEMNEEHSEKLKPGSHSLLIYLKSRTGSFVPHILYIIEITPKITLTILNELTVYGTLSSSVASLVKQLNNFQSHPLARSPIGSFEAFEIEFRNLIDVIWKAKIDIEKEKHMKKLISKWEQLKQYELEAFFQMPKEKTSNPRLESSLSSCSDLLKTVFEECVAIPCLKIEKTTQSAEYQEVLKIMQKISVKRLTDVADFLEYITEYPGLIHFIYIDRNSDCLIAPNVILKKGHLNGVPSLKQKIWKMVSVGRRYIDGVKNYCCVWKDEDLYFYYNIWFEDSTGRVIKPTAYPSLKNSSKKGIICGNSYKKLIQECFPGASYEHIMCYEFFCAHLESTPMETIVDHCRKLCTQLWDFNGAYRTSLDLL